MVSIFINKINGLFNKTKPKQYDPNEPGLLPLTPWKVIILPFCVLGIALIAAFEGLFGLFN